MSKMKRRKLDIVNPDTHCPYPKHRGWPWEDVVERDPSYAGFLMSVDGPADLTPKAAELLEELLEELDLEY